MPRRDVHGRASYSGFPAIPRSSKFVGTGKGRDLPRSPRISGRVVAGDVRCGDPHTKCDNDQGDHALIVLMSAFCAAPALRVGESDMPNPNTSKALTRLSC